MSEPTEKLNGQCHYTRVDCWVVEPGEAPRHRPACRKCKEFRQYQEKPWIGVDLDGTLALYDCWRGAHQIGKPIPDMMERVQRWLAAGHRVKLFTARACDKSQLPPVENWLLEHGIGHIEITNEKDYLMMSLWDDRCVPVHQNNGTPALPVHDENSFLPL